MDKEQLEQAWNQIRPVMEEQGDQAVVAFVEQFPEPDRTEVYGMTARCLYFREWQGKTLDRYAAFAEAVIERYLAAAREAGTDGDRLLQFANASSYNLAANLAECWPDENIPKEQRHFRNGLKSAQRCVELRRRLNKDSVSMANGYWMVGAHQLALGLWKDATESFSAAAQIAPSSSLTQALCNGFAGLALSASGCGAGAGRYADAVAKLQHIAETDEQKKSDALFYLSQLQHCRAMYVGNRR